MRERGHKDTIILSKTTDDKILLARKLSSAIDTLFTTHLTFAELVERHMDNEVRTIIITELKAIEQVKYYISLIFIETDRGTFHCPNLVMIAAVPFKELMAAIGSVAHPRNIVIRRWKKKKRKESVSGTKLPKPTNNLAVNSRYKLE